MHLRHLRPLRAAFFASLACSFSPAFAWMDPALPPAGNFDLSHWKLTLPVDAQGGTTGVATEVHPPQLVGPPGYGGTSWFYTDVDAAMTFWAPVNGAKTSGTKYPRSELRELLDPGDDNVNWTTAGNSVLIATAKVTQVPGTGKTIVGQIHGFDTGPLVKLQYEYSASAATGKLVALVNVLPNATSPVRYTLGTGIKLGAKFSYQIKVWNSGGVASLSVTGGSVSMSAPIDPAWNGIGMYFKAGDYVQDTGTSSSIGGAVSFYALAASHPNDGLKIVTEALPNAVRGTPYEQTLAATGGAAGYRWSIASGLLPQGMSLSTEGVISGTPTTAAVNAGTHSLILLVTDTRNNTMARTLKLTVS